jgi:flavodoxin
MKVLVVYDSVSPQKLTAKVAEAIAQTLRERGLEVDSFFINDVDKAAVKNYECLIAGAPTMAFRASRGMLGFLGSFQKKECSGKMGAAFDTQIQGRFTGNAAKGIEKKLEDLGFKIVASPLVAYVGGKMNEMNLKEGELEKAKSWAEEVAKKLVG